MLLPRLGILHFHFWVVLLREPVASSSHSIVYCDIDPHCMTRGYDRHIWILHPWLGHELLVYMDPQCTSFGGHISVNYRYGFIRLGKARFSLTL